MSSSSQDSELQLLIGRGMDGGAPPPEIPSADEAGPSALPMIDIDRLDADQPLPLLDGAADLPEAPQPSGALSDRAPIHGSGPSGFWLDGDVLMCPCPSCGAPMTVRLWLLVADCWVCATSIELTEEQQREAEQLLEQRKIAAPPATPSPPPAGKPTARDNGEPPASPARQPATKKPSAPAPPAAKEQPSPPTAPKRSPQDTKPQRTTPPKSFSQRTTQQQIAPPAPIERPTTSPQPHPQQRARFRDAPPPAPAPAQPAQHQATPANLQRTRLRQITTRRAVTAWINEFFRFTPAWLISAVFHLVLMTLLGILTFPEDEGPQITLSTAVSRQVREGGEIELPQALEEQFDLPPPANVDLEDPEVREVLIRADQEARELRVDPDAPPPNQPRLQRVKSSIAQVGNPRAALAARDPRVRVEMVKREGGTTLTEAAVARGLRWLARHQNRDGSWSLDRFDHSPGCTCGGVGRLHSDSAATSLALLPFLGAGQSHVSGRYKDVVARGLRWLLETQKPNGDLRGDSGGNSGMYAHGQGAIVLCEAFVVSNGDQALRIPAQRAIDFIVEAQHEGGGWRYRPGQAGDTSVLGWQLMALQSARMAGLTVPAETLELAGQYLDTVQSHDGARYKYIPTDRATHTMTAEALLCRMYLGWTADTPGLDDGIAYLLDEHSPHEQSQDIYYWYYGTQAMHHFGGPQWDRWNQQMRDLLVITQDTRGHAAGSWRFGDGHSRSGGRIYCTSLAICTLEVYYRHLPLFRQIDLD